MNAQTADKFTILNEVPQFVSPNTLMYYVDMLGGLDLNKLIASCLKKGIPSPNIGIALTYNLYRQEPISGYKDLLTFIGKYNSASKKCTYRKKDLFMCMDKVGLFLYNPYNYEVKYEYFNLEIVNVVRTLPNLVNDKGIVLEFDESTDEIFNLETFKNAKYFALLRC